MKIALLIGVDSYTNGVSDLPACKKDVDSMKSIIHATKLFEKILVINNDCNGENVKKQITDFVEKLMDSEIEELFFYFTGHGEYYNNEFYYILSDFNEQRRKQTTLENEEIDQWIRSLNPKLTIKVVDACNSGTSYIKNETAISDYLEKSKNKFNNCYFMFSSSQTQYSYQDNELSHFTRSFLASLFKKNDEKIRYKV